MKESDRESVEAHLSSIQKEMERANKRIQDLRGALQEFSDQSDLEADPLDILDDSASSGDEDGHWAGNDGPRTFEHGRLYKGGDLEDGTAATRRIADVDDFENITPNTLQKWRVERQTGDDDDDTFISQKREDGDDKWYSSASSSSVASAGGVGSRSRGYQKGVRDTIDDGTLPNASTRERGLPDGDGERAWFEDSSPPGSPKPTFL